MKRLQKMRVHGGYSQRALAQQLGVDHGTVGRLEKQHGVGCHPRTRRKFEQFFGLTLEQLLEEVDDGPKALAAVNTWKSAPNEVGARHEV